MEDMIINEGDYSRLTECLVLRVPGTSQGRASSEGRSSSTGIAAPRRSFDDRLQTKRCCRTKGDLLAAEEWLRVPDDQGHSSGTIQRRAKLNRSESDTSSLSAESSSKPLHRLQASISGGGGGTAGGSLAALKAMTVAGSSVEDVELYTAGGPETDAPSRRYHYLTLAAGQNDARLQCRASPGLQSTSGERVRRTETESIELDRSGQKRRRSRKVYVLRHIHSSTNIEVRLRVIVIVVP